MHGVGVVLTFVRVLLVCFGELAVLCSLVFARVRVTVLGSFFCMQFPVPPGSVVFHCSLCFCIYICSKFYSMQCSGRFAQCC